MWTKLNGFVLSLVTRAKIQREEGQALVEYVLIISLVAVVCIAALSGLATSIIGKLNEVATAI